MKNKIIFWAAFVCFACVPKTLFAGYELNQYVKPSGQVVEYSACLPAGSTVVRQESYKFFGVLGQNTITVTSSGTSLVKPGYIQMVKDYVLSFLQSVPYLREIRSFYDRSDTNEIENNYPTNHNSPYFTWDDPNATSPVVEYWYTVKNSNGEEVFSGTCERAINYFDIEVEENDIYTISIKAINESGNWGNESNFIYIYDKSGPFPVNYIQLQAWGEQYFHPLLINLEFPFTEYLDENMMNVETMSLGKQKWDGTWESISGDVAYNDDNQALIFKSNEPLKAMAGYKVNFKDVYDLAGNTFSGDIYFKTFIGAAMKAEVFSPDGNVNLSIPHWGLKKDALVMVTKLEGEVDIVARANRKVELRLNTLLPDNNVYRVEIQDLKYSKIDEFNKNADLSFFVPDSDEDGLWDGTDIRVKDLILAKLDEEKKDWRIIEEEDGIRIKNAPERPALKGITVPVKKAVYYRLISYLAPGDTIDNIIVYPNPFRPSFGHTEITFLRVPSDATINIYNIAGEKIRNFPSADQGQVLWDGTNNHGLKVASGVYVALIRVNGAKKVFKIAIER